MAEQKTKKTNDGLILSRDQGAILLARKGIVKTKRAAIYVRVSNNEQDTDLQETELREYVENRGWICIPYRDKGQSGAKNDRPALTQLLNDLRRRKVDVIVVWALDSAGTLTKPTIEHCG